LIDDPDGIRPVVSAGDRARLRVSDVSVTFGRNRVLRGVSLNVAPAELHALIGQNGSGKSTLAKVLTGLYVPDPGAVVEVDGVALRLPVRPADSRTSGVAVVHQSLGLVPEMTVLENMRVGRLQAHPFTRRIRWARERAAAAEVFDRLGRHVSLDALVHTLSEEDRASVAIARALQDTPEGGGLVIFDESTRALSRRSLEHFYEMLDGVIASGTSALLITHRLEEVIDAADRVTVLRDGQVVASGVAVKGRSEQDLAQLMLGRELGQVEAGGGRSHSGGRAVVELIDVQSARLTDVSMSIAACEIVGITGLADSGYHEVPYVLAGAKPARGGRLSVDGKDVDLVGLTPSSATEAGLALVPGEREVAGLAFDLSVLENAALPVTSVRGSRFGRIPRTAELAEFEPWFDRLQLRPRNPSLPVGKLSGGNQQKVVLAKWLARSPKVLILHEPTQAVDIGAREIIVNAVREAAAAGCAVLVASGDENELSMLCHRILVFRDGRVAQELRDPQTPDEIVSAIFLNTERRRLRSSATV